MDYNVSQREGRECYNKPCACLNCMFELLCAVGARGDNDDRPCDYCNGTEGDRLSTFNCPTFQPIKDIIK